tara:strand:+ start:2966 stop:3754 length:789 start_codon:yes stop_codon:yes gene_type:complete
MKDIKYFATKIVDNFFEQPQEIVKFANSLKFKKGPYGYWPGVRSDGLHETNYNFFNSVLTKILALSFDYKHHNVNWDNVEMYFQKTYPYDNKNKKNIVNTGLVHADGEYPLVGIIYLTEGADLESGTSIVEPIKKYTKAQAKKDSDILTERKIKFYKKLKDKVTKKDLNDYGKLVNDCNSKFYEKIKVNNIFNRALLYNGNDYHKANSFFTGKKERLSLVFFIKNITSTAFFPIQRLDANTTILNYDSSKKESSKKRNNTKN